MCLVRFDDAPDQWMAHHVGGDKAGEGDAAYLAQNFHRLFEPAFRAARQIDLGRVARYHRLGAKAHAGEEHFHLLGCGVLGFVQNDERVIQGAAAHVGQRGDFDRAFLEHFADLVETHQVV